MLKNYKDLKDLQTSYELCLEIYRKNVIALIKSLENKPLIPGILGSSSPTKLEKNLKYKCSVSSVLSVVRL